MHPYHSRNEARQPSQPCICCRHAGLSQRADEEPLGLHWEKPAQGQGCPWDKRLGNCRHPQWARCRCPGRERGRPFIQHLLRAGGLFSVLLFIDIHNNPGGAGVRQRGCAVHWRSVPPLPQRELVARSSCPVEGLLFPDFLHLGGAPTGPWPVCGMCEEALNAGPGPGLPSPPTSSSTFSLFCRPPLDAGLQRHAEIADR